MMRKVKNVALLLLTLLMGMSNFNVQIFAEDGTIPKEESTYSATYEFVLDEEDELPKEVITRLPETRNDLKQGDVLTNQDFENVETDEGVYSFKEWNYKEYTIEDSDVHFVGTWHKETKLTEKEKPTIFLNEWRGKLFTPKRRKEIRRLYFPRIYFR